MKRNSQMLKTIAVSLAGILTLTGFPLTAGAAAVEPGSAEEAAKAAGLDPGEKKTLSIFFNYSWYPVSEWKGIIPEEITKLTGVDLDITVAVDSQQLGLLIASGDMPDLIATDCMLSNLSTSELCYDWQSLIDEYDTGWEVDQEDKANAFSFSQEEDKFFTVMSHYANAEDWKSMDAMGVGAPMCGTLLYRRDLYEEMGSPKLESLEDIKNMLLMAKEKYPDMSPMLFDPAALKTVYFRQAFGLGSADNNFTEQEDGSWKALVNDPRYKEYLAFLNDLYRNGLLSAENYGMDREATLAQCDAGKVFAYSYCTQYCSSPMNSGIAANVPGAVWYEAPVVGDIDGAYDASVGWMGTFITKNCSDPETAIRFLQFLHSEAGARLTQWGREGIEWTIDEEGHPIFSQEWTDSIANGTNDEQYNTWMYLGGSKINEAVGRCVSTNPEYVPNYPTLRQHFANKAWVKYAEPVEGSDEKFVFDQLFDTASGAVPTGEVKVILADSDEAFEANFQELLDNCNAIGMEELETYMDEHIREAMTVYGVD